MSEKGFIINGKRLFSYCKDNGISYDAVYKRIIRKGMTPEEAVKPLNKCKHVLKEGTTLKDWCELNNACYQSLLYKMKKENLTCDEVVSFLVNKRKKSIEGLSVLKWCRKNRVDPHKIYMFFKDGKTEEYILNWFKDRKQSFFEKYKVSLKDYCKMKNLNYARACYLKHKGVPYEDMIKTLIEEK